MTTIYMRRGGLYIRPWQAKPAFAQRSDALQCFRQLFFIKKWNYIQRERQYIKKEREHMHNHIYPQPICCKKAG